MTKKPYEILNHQFDRVEDVKKWIDESNSNREGTPQLVLWGVLDYALKNQDSQPSPSEVKFVTDVGLSVISTWKQESETKEGADLRQTLLVIANTIDELRNS